MQNYTIRDKYVQGKSIKKNKEMKNTKFRTEVGKGRGSGMEKAYWELQGTLVLMGLFFTTYNLL